MAQIETRYGLLAVPDDADDLIVRHLARYGEWAWCEARFIASVLKDGARLLDGGAYLGTFGLGVAMQRPIGLLCAVEANPEALVYLRDNLARLAPCPCEMIDAPIRGAVPVGRSALREAGNMGATSFVELDLPDAVADGDDGVSLAGLRARFGAFDMVKLDIEGLELPALRADATALAGGATAIWAECNETARSLHLAEFLLSIGLPLWYFAFPSHNRRNANGVSEAIFPMGFEAGLLAAPAVPPALDAALVAEGCVLRPIGSTQALRAAMWETPRWGRPGWELAESREALAALAGRELLGQAFSDFLVADVTEAAPARSLWEKLAEIEAALGEAQRDVSEKQAALAAMEREREATVADTAAHAAARRAAEDRAARAEAEAARQAAMRLGLVAELGALRERLAPEAAELPVAVADAPDTLAEIADLREKLRSIEASTSWLATAPLRAVLDKRGTAKRALRGGRKLAGKLVRRVRGWPDP